MNDLSPSEKEKIIELTEFALTPIEGKVTNIGKPSLIKMFFQTENGPKTETQKVVFTVSIKSIVGEDHLLFSDKNGLWNGVRNICHDLAYSNKISESQRDKIIEILWSEEFSSKNI